MHDIPVGAPAPAEPCGILWGSAAMDMGRTHDFPIGDGAHGWLPSAWMCIVLLTLGKKSLSHVCYSF